GELEVGAEILSQIPDDYFVDYYKATIAYRFLLKQSNADQTVLQQAKETVDKIICSHVKDARS
ncbi:MAG: hypothetical protein Q8R43_01970, partial [Alphaproteobacteria bacterium]|nr:hypothetical protein [Alphaproteobacteria bacterium]